MSIITTELEIAVKTLNENKIVAIPTETVYGLAANATSESAIRQVFAVKQRPLTHPLILHVAEGEDLNQWVEAIPDYAKQLMQAFWPGPLTLVFQAKPKVLSPLISAGQTTLAIRCPKHPLTQTLLKSLSFPLVAPSANSFGKISPTTARHVQQSFPDYPLLILDGGRCPLGIESTIVTATDSHHYQLLRQGIIDETMLAHLVPNQLEATKTTIRVPGRLTQHYQPNKKLVHFDFGDRKSLQQCIQNLGSAYYLLSFDKQTAGYQWPDNPEDLAYELYYQLRIADESSAEYLITELPPNEKKWLGVRERLIKASYPIRIA